MDKRLERKALKGEQVRAEDVRGRTGLEQKALEGEQVKAAEDVRGRTG